MTSILGCVPIAGSLSIQPFEVSRKRNRAAMGFECGTARQNGGRVLHRSPRAVWRTGRSRRGAEEDFRNGNSCSQSGHTSGEAWVVD